MGAGFRCHGWCHIRHGRGCAGYQERLRRITMGPEANAMESGTIHIVRVLDPCQPELIREEVFQQPGKASGRERLASGVIDPGTVIGVEPSVLMFVVIAAVNLVGAPDIHHGQQFALVIRAVI